MNRHVPLILLLCAALQACNSRMVDEGGIGGTGMVAGTVTDVTNLSVNGESFDVSGAQFLRNDNPELNLQDTVAVGEYVMLSTGSGNQVATVTYRSPVTGPVQEGDGSDLVVLGQAVRVDDLAVLRGFRNVQDLVAGDVVEISGFRDGDLTTATAVNLRDEENEGQQLQKARLEGSIDSVDLNARAFTVNDVRVDYGSARLDGIDENELQPGMDVIITGSALNATLLIADQVKRDHDVAPVPAGNRVSFQGLATSTRQGQTLQVNGTLIKLTGTTVIDDGQVRAMLSAIDGSSAANIAVDDRVLVAGVADGMGNVDADVLHIVRQANRFDLEGSVEDISVPLNRLVVDGLFVELDSSTLLLELGSGEPLPLSIDALQIGQSVRVQGNRTSPSRLVALRVTRLN